jgi:hypothetical protein
MVIQTATSITCCHGPTESKTSQPWPDNDAYEKPQRRADDLVERWPRRNQMNLEGTDNLQIEAVTRTTEIPAQLRHGVEVYCCVAGDRLRTAMSSIMRRRSGLILSHWKYSRLKGWDSRTRDPLRQEAALAIRPQLPRQRLRSIPKSNRKVQLPQPAKPCGSNLPSEPKSDSSPLITVDQIIERFGRRLAEISPLRFAGPRQNATVPRNLLFPSA